jgi:hypothetical protein
MDATDVNEAGIGRRRQAGHGELAVTDLVQTDHVRSLSVISWQAC